MTSNNKNVLIAHAFFLKNDSKQYSDKFKPYPPLATLYSASLLKQKGCNISFFDAVLAEGLENFYETVIQTKPSILIIYEDDFNFLTKMCLSHVRDTTMKMIEYAKQSNITIIVHSSDASDNPDIYLSQGADFVIYGEGEETLSDIVNCCLAKNTMKPEEIKGIYYLDKKAVKKTSARKTLRSLDDLPQPAWELVDFNLYRNAWKQRHGFYSVNMVTTRGCPYKCNWCAKPIWGQQYSCHSPEYVVEQLEWLVQNAAPEHIWFADDIFGLKKGWIESFAEKITKKKIQVSFMIQSRADLINITVAQALKSAGCSEVWLGVESGSQMILDNMDKGITLSQVREARLLLAKSDVGVGFFIQLGYPGEDIEEIEKTRAMILELKPEKIGVSVSYPLPGTLFYQKVKGQLSNKTHWLESNDLDTVFHSTFNAEFYRRVRTHLHDELSSLHTENHNKKNWENKWQKLLFSAEDYRVEKPTQIEGLPNLKNKVSTESANVFDAEYLIKLQTL
ncbi:B12-binding domain-containing radical SAM protein [Aliikangiella sp. IMCC44359]|uniref:B12-binding domain-containing radical SAM protein n=1 Tax=Aliikangiella sp. IMCC44359 TaxID=3459125 RepID=UPI00403AACCE